MKLSIHLGHNNPVRIAENSAGLAIYDDRIYFIEIDEENNSIINCMSDLPEGCVVNGSIKDFDMLEHGLAQIRSQTGRIREPVNIGLPLNDVVIRPLNFPKMSLDDIRGTIDLNFEEYFPFPRLEAVFDVIWVQTPADLHERNEITALAVAARRSTVEHVLDAARKAGIPAGPIEPVNFAILRAVPEAKEGLCVFATPHSVASMWNGQGIFFRSANNVNNIQDILNTIQFLGTQYRSTQIYRLIFYGLNFQLGGDTGMEIVNVDDEYLTPRGLAMRDVDDKQKVDLRPMEYVELERRRYAFNPNRLILWLLLSGFLMLSFGTISFSLLQMKDISKQLEEMRDDNEELTRRRVELAQANSRLEHQKEHTNRVLEFLKSDIPALEIMNEIELHAGAGVKLDEAVFERGITGVTVNIDGRAQDDDAVLTLTGGLKESGLFANVMLPVSQKDQLGQIVFKIILRVKDIL